MKTRNFLIAAVIVTLIVFGIWYLLQAPKSEVLKAASTPKVSAQMPIAPKPDIMPPAVELKPSSVTGATQTASGIATLADSRVELNKTVNDIVSHLQSNDYRIFNTYTEPDIIAKKSPEEILAGEASAQKTSASAWGQYYMQQAAIELQGQEPKMNAAGDEAIYQVTPMVPGIRPGLVKILPKPLTFIKIDGKWYLKGGGSMGFVKAGH